MQHSAVKRQFQEQIAHYTNEKQATDSYLIPRVVTWLKQKKFKRTITIGEFGGGAGQLLNIIGKKYPNSKLINAEIVPEYREWLVSKKIDFRVSSILESGFPSRSFDVLIIRDVLHHLVANNLDETMRNQMQALRELKRLIKPGGAIFIEELTNGSAIISRLIYSLTRLNALLGIRLPLLSVDPTVIVYFMQPHKLIETCEAIFGKSTVQKTIIPVPINFASSVAHLGSRVMKTVLTIQQ